MIGSEISKIIADTYRASNEPGAWQNLIFPLTRLFNASSALLQVEHTDASASRILGQTPNFELSILKPYADYYFKFDRWKHMTIECGSGVPIIGSEHLSDQELLNSEMYGDWLKHLEIFRCCGGLFEFSGGFITIGLHRELRTTEFNSREKQMLALLLPHVAQAYDLSITLQSVRRDRQLAFAGLDALSAGTIIVNAAGRVLYFNDAAKRLLTGEFGLAVTNGSLRARASSEEVLLKNHIRSAVAAVTGCVAEDLNFFNSVKPFQVGPLMLTVRPLSPDAAPADHKFEPGAIIFISARQPITQIDATAVAKLFGLTLAEAKLVVALVLGETLRSYAEQNRISYNTARSQLRAVFWKTGHSRQVELVSDILSKFQTVAR